MSKAKKSESTMKEYTMPSLILVIICFVVTFSLVITYQITEPIIKIAAEKQAEEARKIVLTESTGFELILSNDGPKKTLHENVLEVYRSINNAGYVIVSKDKGYGGEIKVITGVAEDGLIKNILLLEQKETPGLGTKVGEKGFLEQFIGKDSVEGMQTISGATISSNAMIRSVDSALQQMEKIEEGGL